MILIQSEIGWVLGCDGEYGPVVLGSWSFKVGESASIFLAGGGVYVDSPHQKVLRHSGLTIHALDNLAVTGNWTPNLQMANQLNDNYAPSSSHLLKLIIVYDALNKCVTPVVH